MALALLPFLMPPTLAVPLVSMYSAVFGLVLTLQLRRDLMAAPLAALLSGALVGTPVGVWGLATLPASWLRRLIGCILMGVALGMHLFRAVDHVRLRRVVFALLFVLGLTLCLRG